MHKATTEQWYNVAVGSSACHISVNLVNREYKIGIEFYIPDNKDLFDSLHSHKDEIEKNILMDLHWNRLDNNKTASVSAYIKGLDFNK